MGKMFRVKGKKMGTWNPRTGCAFQCLYCYARRLVETRLKDSPKYRQGFMPTFHPAELTKRFKPGNFVFVSSMGDISFATREEIMMILDRIKQFPETRFLLQSKNPQQFIDWQVDYPDNVYLGTTIETNHDYGVSKAPRPYLRFEALARTMHPHKFVSLEPLMDFNIGILVDWIRVLRPEIIEVGADNYGHHLPEPSGEKVLDLLRQLKQICPHVEEKDGLERLTGKCQINAGIGPPTL